MATYQRKTIQTYINITRDEYQRLGAIARLEGSNIGDYLAMLCRQALKKYANKIADLQQNQNKST